MHYKLVDVCMATSAAPIFRSLAVLDDPISHSGPQQVFADGGLWANNPIIVGLVDALKIAKPNQSIEIFSLGTCPTPEGKYITEKSAHRTMLDWRLGAEVATLSIYAQEQAFDDVARLLANAISNDSRTIRCVRFPSAPVSAEMMPYLGIDDTRKEALDRLIRQAYSDADLTKSHCDDSTDQDGQMILRLMLDLPEIPTNGVFEKSRSSATIFRVGGTMKNCSKDVRAYHDQKVNLPQKERDNMRDRRDNNRERLRIGLEKADKPLPKKFPRPR